MNSQVNRGRSSLTDVERADRRTDGDSLGPETNIVLRVVLADDHALFRGGLVLLIRLMDRPVEILEANDFDQAMSHLSEGPPVDLLLLDLLMPGMNGIEGISRICKTWPDVPVVVVSVREDSKAIRDALSAGAMGYIPKTSSPEVTTNALRFILSGGIYVPPHVLHLSDPKLEPLGPGLDEGSGAPPEGVQSGMPFGLTERQLEVLQLMAEGRSNKDIAADLDIAPGTVKMHVSRIFKTLGVDNRTQAASLLTKLTAATGDLGKDS